MSEVTLNVHEARLAVDEGGRRRLRRIYGLAKGDLFEPEHRFDSDIEAAAAELAVAKHLGLWWTPSIGPQTAEVGDVGEWEVRWKEKPNAPLIVREWTPPERKCVLVVGRLPTFRVVGWVLAGDAQAEAAYRVQYPDNPKPRYEVPQGDLAPL